MPIIPPIGPDPVLISRNEVDALYETLRVVTNALLQIGVDYIVTGGSLLGAIRQHSILFCDDDIDIAIIDHDGSCYKKVTNHLQDLLGKEYKYSIKPWEAGDKVRPVRASNVFLDIFVLRKYKNIHDLRKVLGVKRNGLSQSKKYVQDIVSIIQKSAFSQNEFDGLFPFWHFATRKAIELWPKEIYRPAELFPVSRSLKFGPLTEISGPRMPVLLLRRAFGSDCFEVYYQSGTHQNKSKNSSHLTAEKKQKSSTESLKPIIQGGGAWEGGIKIPLEHKHYLPMQPLSRAKRRPTLHCRDQLLKYLETQTRKEENLKLRYDDESDGYIPPRCTVYMDGVFDLFHFGHLRAIQECAKLGDRVIIGVTGQEDATGYKRPPIIAEKERAAIIKALREVDQVICPCPLIVTEDFMEEHHIDLVVHGFANEEDAQKQTVFFEAPIKNGKFERIPYYKDLSTTDIIEKIKSLPEL